MFFTAHKRKRSILTVLLAFAIILNINIALLDTSGKAVSQSELNALKQQQEELAKQKANIQKKADELSNQVNAQTQKLEVLNAKLEVTNQELENLSEQIIIYTNTIAEMENELNLANLKEQEQLEKYKKRIRAMEENGAISYIDVIFQANSFSDLLTRIDAIGEIADYDNNLIQDVRDAQDKVQKAKEDMEAEMAAQELIFASYKEKQAELSAQQEEVQAVLASLKSDSAEYQKQLEAAQTLQSSINSQISDMQDKLAQQERIKAEQAAAAALASGKNNWSSSSGGTGTGQDIVDFAETFLGVPYVYGGTSPKGFDCSGLVYYCYTHFGYSVNRTATGLSYNGVAVDLSDLQPGDVLIFSEKNSSAIAHCGIYIGDGLFIHAPQTGDVVKKTSLTSSSYANRIWGARRIV